MKQAIILVPGLLGSQLHFKTVFARAEGTLWVNKGNLVIYGIRGLALARDGISPKIPFGMDLYARGLLDLYTPLLRRLLQLYNGAYELQAVSYDWRLSMEITGKILADQITTLASPSAPCSLVCHSIGGLVARYAYRVLKLRGLESYVRRIVTLGTPHYGCYQLGAVWGLWDDVLLQLAVASNLLTAAKFLTHLIDPSGQIKRSLKLAANVVGTWPSVYQSLTFLGPVQAAEDPGAPAFYDLANHKTPAFVDGALLAAARVAWQGAMLDASTSVPVEKIKCVAGYQNEEISHEKWTMRALTHPELLDTQDAYLWTNAGDNTVPVWSALSASTDRFVLNCEHDLLPSDPITLERIDEWLFPRTPAPPIPLVELLDGASKQTPVPSNQPSPVDMQARVQQGQGGRCLTGPCQC